MMAFLHTLSPLGLGLSLTGIIVAVGVVLALNVLPSFLVRPLVGLAAVLLVGGGIYQLAYARATHAEHTRQLEATIRTERAHAAAALKISTADRNRAAANAAALKTANARLQEMTRALETDPDRDRACIDGGTARRLRAL